MSKYRQTLMELDADPKKWLITGVAGFIGSNLLEALLRTNQWVIGLDNFATGFPRNLDEVKSSVTEEQWRRFRFVEGDICKLTDCLEALTGVDYVLHQAALGSVPRSLENPIATNQANIDGFLNMLLASRDAHVKRFVYAASSSTYGDDLTLPKKEDCIGKALSPYAVTKYVNELYAEVFSRNYGFHTIGLRYFNVFGPRQDPDGAYAAVIPRWIAAMINNDRVFINGDGETSRDFCFIDNAVQANILAATCGELKGSTICNVAVGERTSLNQLFELIKVALAENGVNYEKSPCYQDFREGDVRHSLADISRAREVLGYSPSHRIGEGLPQAMPWYLNYF